MVERLPGSQPLFGHVAQQLGQQVAQQGLLTEALELLLEPVVVRLVLRDVRELFEQLGVEGHLPREHLVLAVARSAEQAEDPKYLITFSFALEERLPRDQLGEDAARGPHVDGLVVLRDAAASEGRTG